MRVSKILFGKMVWSSFRSFLAVCSMWIWNLLMMFRCIPFLWRCTTCITLSMGPKECALSWSVVQNWKYGCCGKKHSCVLCSECRTVFHSGPHKPFGNLGRLICKHLMMKPCQESGLFVYIEFQWCCSSGTLNNDHTIFPNRIFDTLIKPSVPLLTH